MFIFPSQRGSLAPLPIQRGGVFGPLPLNILTSRCFVGPFASQHLADCAVTCPAGALCDITLGLIFFVGVAAHMIRIVKQEREAEDGRVLHNMGAFAFTQASK